MPLHWIIYAWILVGLRFCVSVVFFPSFYFFIRIHVSHQYDWPFLFLGGLLLWWVCRIVFQLPPWWNFLVCHTVHLSICFLLSLSWPIWSLYVHSKNWENYICWVSTLNCIGRSMTFHSFNSYNFLMAWPIFKAHLVLKSEQYLWYICALYFYVAIFSYTVLILTADTCYIAYHSLYVQCKYM